MIFAQLLKNKNECKSFVSISRRDNYTAMQFVVAVAKTPVLKMKILTRRLMITSLLKDLQWLKSTHDDFFIAGHFRHKIVLW